MVYPFTTEDISSYFEYLELDQTSVLTVGSSGDQALNAILSGAKEVTLYDLNPDTHEFVESKVDMLLNSSYQDFYSNIMNDNNFKYFDDKFPLESLVKMNTYMSSEEKFNELKDKLYNANLNYITGDIYDFSFVNDTYDRIILSNATQRDYYLGYLNNPDDKHEQRRFFHDAFKRWHSKLNHNGIIQLAYLYSKDAQIQELYNMVCALDEYLLEILEFPSIGNEQVTSAVVTHTKKRK